MTAGKLVAVVVLVKLRPKLLQYIDNLGGCVAGRHSTLRNQHSSCCAWQLVRVAAEQAEGAAASEAAAAVPAAASVDDCISSSSNSSRRNSNIGSSRTKCGASHHLLPGKSHATCRKAARGLCGRA